MKEASQFRRSRSWRWRACHYYPINTFQMTIRDKLKKIDPDAIVAQRLKRFFSIVQKLRRFKSMKLSTIQDIVRLRAVVHTLPQVQTLNGSYSNADKFTFKHELVTQRNYIESPKDSGYRGIQLVCRYNNRAKRSSHWNGLLIELQIRTRLQHIWATAVDMTTAILARRRLGYDRGIVNNQTLLPLNHEERVHVRNWCHRTNCDCGCDLWNLVVSVDPQAATTAQVNRHLRQLRAPPRPATH